MFLKNPEATFSPEKIHRQYFRYTINCRGWSDRNDLEELDVVIELSLLLWICSKEAFAFENWIQDCLFDLFVGYIVHYFQYVDLYIN